MDFRMNRSKLSFLTFQGYGPNVEKGQIVTKFSFSGAEKWRPGFLHEREGVVL